MSVLHQEGIRFGRDMMMALSPSGTHLQRQNHMSWCKDATTGIIDSMSRLSQNYHINHSDIFFFQINLWGMVGITLIGCWWIFSLNHPSPYGDTLLVMGLIIKDSSIEIWLCLLTNIFSLLTDIVWLKWNLVVVVRGVLSSMVLFLWNKRSCQGRHKEWWCGDKI